VEFNDFNKAMEKIGLYYSPQEMMPLFKVYDVDGSNTIDYKEFSGMVFGTEGGVKSQMIKRPANANQQ
jgi:Ca2+-binding EF-hand superfamily protein